MQTSTFFDSVEGSADFFSSRDLAVKLLVTPTVNTIERKWVLVPLIDRPQPTNRFVLRVIP